MSGAQTETGSKQLFSLLDVTMDAGIGFKPTGHEVCTEEGQRAHLCVKIMVLVGWQQTGSMAMHRSLVPHSYYLQHASQKPAGFLEVG